jgi:hypothetical protein
LVDATRPAGHDWISWIIFFRSVSSTSVGFLSWRFRFLDFDERMWLRYAFLRLNWPDAVFLNRFFAPDVDFIFGM